jgi:hypothetical protein
VTVRETAAAGADTDHDGHSSNKNSVLQTYSRSLGSDADDEGPVWIQGRVNFCDMGRTADSADLTQSNECPEAACTMVVEMPLL